MLYPVNPSVLYSQFLFGPIWWNRRLVVWSISRRGFSKCSIAAPAIYTRDGTLSAARSSSDASHSQRTRTRTSVCTVYRAFTITSSKCCAITTTAICWAAY